MGWPMTDSEVDASARDWYEAEYEAAREANDMRGVSPIRLALIETRENVRRMLLDARKAGGG